MITAAELARHIAVLAADSLGRRTRPGPDLDRAAQYLAGQFQQLGLESGVTRYPVPGQLPVDYAASQLRFTSFVRDSGREIRAEWGLPFRRDVVSDFVTGAYFLSDSVPQAGGGTQVNLVVRPSAVLIAGRHTSATLRQAAVRDRIVLYLPPPGLDSATRQRTIAELTAVSRGLVVIDGTEDSATFAAHAAAARHHPPFVVDTYLQETSSRTGWAVQVWPGALGVLLTQVGVDLARTQAATAPLVQVLPSLGVRLTVGIGTPASELLSAPNVVASLPGTDSLLDKEVVIIAAHLDDRGSPTSGEGDNAAGAGLLALAKAFSQPGARPRRSLLLLATSGGAADGSGSQAFLADRPPPWSKYVVCLTLDRLGGGTRDSLLVNGLHDVEFALTPVWVAAAHPELRLTVDDGGTVATAQSDQAVFVRHGVPSLRLHGGMDLDAEPEQRAGQPTALDTALAVRRLQLVFYMVQALANGSPSPRWSSAGRQHRLELLTP